MTSPGARTTRLAELAAPTRGRPRYAPLTAGLLARKGEAQPASPLFAAEVLGLSPQLTTLSRPQLPDLEFDDTSVPQEEPEPDIREALRPWRTRRAEAEVNGFDHAGEDHLLAREAATHGHTANSHVSHERVHRAPGKDSRAALTVELDLETLARLVLEARKRASSPGRVIEQTLSAHLPATGACPLCDSFHVAP